MKLVENKSYSIENMTEVEFEVLKKIIESVQIEGSSQVLDIVDQFRKLLQIQQLVCDGCETTQQVQVRECPHYHQQVALCDQCYQSRKELS
jgi:hypothetical protein